MTTFFNNDTLYLFRPLSGRFREMVVGCLNTLYDRLYGPHADYQVLITRTDLKALFLPVISSTPILSGTQEEELLDTVQGEEARINWMIRELEETGWIEHSPDKGTARSVYRLTRIGKRFAEVFASQDGQGLVSRQRNVRNTANALKAYLSDGDPYNLMDAFTFSAKVNSDLSDEISELHERKRDVMRQAAAQAENALGQFQEYMEKHFLPDISIRLSADSVDKHSSEIRAIVDQIRAWPENRRNAAEQLLRQRAPQFVEQTRINPIDHALVTIEAYLSSACATKMPELRAALGGFMRRIEIISRQVSLLTGHQDGSVVSFASRLAKQSSTVQAAAWAALSARVTPYRPRLVDPGRIRLRDKMAAARIPELQEISEPTREERLQASIEHALQSAFTVSEDNIYEAVLEQLDDSPSLHTRHFQVHDALSLLIVGRAFEVGSLSHAKRVPKLRVEPVQDVNGKAVPFTTELGEFDDFLIKKAAIYE